MRLRVLDFGFVPPYRSQAVYHGVAETVNIGDEPVLTLVNPLDPYVCVGLHQEVALEVDEAYCRERNLPIIRRHVGGGAVYLDRDQMFFHFIFPRDQVPRVVTELYPMFIEPVTRTYQALGINAEFRPVNDIHVNGRKIGGTGAASIDDATVMVGSFMFDFDVASMAKCLRVPSEKFRDKLRQGMDDYMSTMTKELDELPSRDEVKRLFMDNIAATLNVTPEEDEPSDAELAAINQQEQELAEPDWTYQVGRKFVEMGVKIAANTHLTESAHKAPGGLVRVQLLEKDNTIADLVISGDFTCWPDTGPFDLADALKGETLEPESLTQAVTRHMEALQLQIPGVGAEDIVAAIQAAIHRE